MSLLLIALIVGAPTCLLMAVLIDRERRAAKLSMAQRQADFERQAMQHRRSLDAALTAAETHYEARAALWEREAQRKRRRETAKSRAAQRMMLLRP